MKKTVLTFLAISAFAFAGCNEKPKTEAQLEKPETLAPHAPAGMPAQGRMSSGRSGTAAPAGDPHAGIKAREIPAGFGKKGKVIQTMNAGGYSYLEAVDEKGRKTWLALPEIKVSVGDSIEFPEAPPLINFHSKTLNKTFDRISFVPGIRVVK